MANNRLGAALPAPEPPPEPPSPAAQKAQPSTPQGRGRGAALRASSSSSSVASAAPGTPAAGAATQAQPVPAAPAVAVPAGWGPAAGALLRDLACLPELSWVRLEGNAPGLPDGYASALLGALTWLDSVDNEERPPPAVTPDVWVNESECCCTVLSVHDLLLQGMGKTHAYIHF